MLLDTVKQIFYKHQNNCFPFRNLDSIYYRNLVINFCFVFFVLVFLISKKSPAWTSAPIISKKPTILSHFDHKKTFARLSYLQWYEILLRSNLGQGFSEKKIPFMNISIIFSTNNENCSYGKSFAQHHSRKKIYCVYQVLRNTCSKIRAFHCKILDILGKYFMGKCRIGPWYGKT